MAIMPAKTILDPEEGFVRVSLTPEEMDDVLCEVMQHNVTVVHMCLATADKEFPALEPARRLEIALLLADKAAVHLFTAHREALDSKVAAIKDAANANGASRRLAAAGVKHDQ